MKPRPAPSHDESTRPKTPHAKPVPTRADHAVSQAAQATGDDGTMQSSDWMAERTQGANPPPGVPVTNEKRDRSARGGTRESRREHPSEARVRGAADGFPGRRTVNRAERLRCGRVRAGNLPYRFSRS